MVHDDAVDPADSPPKAHQRLLVIAQESSPGDLSDHPVRPVAQFVDLGGRNQLKA